MYSYDTIVNTRPGDLRTGQPTGTQKPKTDYANAPIWYTEQSGMVGDNVSFGTVDETTVPEAANNATQAKADDDDGKLNIFQMIGSAVKGVVKSVVNTVVDIVTDPKKLLMAAGTAVVCTLFPPAGVVLGVIGAAKGLQSGYQAFQAYKAAGTDAEAEAAFENIGASALQVGVSIAGVKASWGAMKATQGSALSQVTKSNAKGFQGLKENVVNNGKAFLEDTVTGGRGFGGDGLFGANTLNAGYKGTQIMHHVAENVSRDGVVKGMSQSLKDGGEYLRTSRATRAGQRDASRYEKMGEEAQQKFDADAAESMQKAGETVKTAEAKVQELEAKVSNATGEAKVELEAQLKTAKGQLKTAQNAQQRVINQQNAFKQGTQTRAELTQKLETAQEAVKTTRTAYEEATKALGKLDKTSAGYQDAVKLVETTRAEWLGARATAGYARSALRATSSGSLTSYAGRWGTFTRDAGYTNGFGALTVPAAELVQDSNETHQRMAAMQQNYSFQTSGGTTAGNYQFGDYTFNSGNYATGPIGTYNYYTDYDIAARNAGAVANQIIM